MGVDDIRMTAASAEHADGARGEVERLTDSA
jgi:hypothetical protein